MQALNLASRKPGLSAQCISSMCLVLVDLKMVRAYIHLLSLDKPLVFEPVRPSLLL